MRAELVTLTICLLALPANAKYSGGTGEPNDPYQIATAADLIALGETPEDYDKRFIMTADIDLDPNLPGRKVFHKAVIAPDTDAEYWFQGTPFAGVFDGNRHTISHLTITRGGFLGMFGGLGSEAQAKNLGLVDVKIAGSSGCIGGLVGDNEGTVAQCYSTGTVSGSSWVGGLVGYNYGGHMTDCYSTGVVSGANWDAGGLVGTNGGTVTHCYSTGAVSGSLDVGGLVGANYGYVLHGVWDVETSGLLGSSGGLGLSTAEMMDPYMLGLNGFANDPNWVLDAGRDYPRLAWQGTPGEIIPEPHIDWLDGVGTAEDPYTINTPDQVIMLGRASALCDKHFVLGADIDLDPKMPGRHVFAQAAIPNFMGVFDGNGHMILHLTVEGELYVGLFGQVASGAEVKDLAVVDVNITGSGCVGGLVGSNGGTLTNCYSTGSLEGGEDVGGLVGANEDSGVVVDSYSIASVSCVSVGGGLVGGNSGDVTQCYSTGVVDGNDDVGGLVGGNGTPWGVPAAVTACYSTGTVSGETNVGGLVGYNWATVAQCYSTAAVDGNKSVGGLVGWNDGAVTHCYSTGVVSGVASVGGLMGTGHPELIADSFWDIQTSGQATSAGGTGKTTAEMQMARTFLDAGWDFVGETTNGTADIWWILEGKDYPRLWWETAAE